MRKYILLLCLIFFIIGNGCRDKKEKKSADSNNKVTQVPLFAKLYPNFDYADFHKLLEKKIEKDSILHPLYSVNEYKSVWVNDTVKTSELDEFIQILQYIDIKHGLSTDLFPIESIVSLSDSINSGVYANDMTTLYKKICDLESLSTKAAIKYITGMTYGFTNPKILFPEDYTIEILQADSIFFEKLYANICNDPISIIKQAQPSDNVYKKMQEAYERLERKKEIELKNIENKGLNFTYKLGDKNQNITAIAERLTILEDYQMDSIGNDSLGMVLDENLLASVNAFRKRISYPEDKEIGSLTIDALNRPIEYYQDRLKANMERYRWKRKKQKEAKNIEVNVASFKVIATQPDSIPLIMKACVGSITNKTPLLQSDISYLNLNPIWNVPTSIAKNEISVSQKKDETYLKRHNMKLYKNGQEVDPETIDWSKVNPNKFGYTIRQSAGGGNSLGRIKFMFNNSFSVYLHDTPAKSAFGRKNRAVSHGCIRLEQPINFAFFCLSPVTDIYKDRLLISIDKPPVSTEGKRLLRENKLSKLPDIINPKEKISLFIDYYTIYMHPNEDMLYYADDVYGYDELILKAINL